MLNSLFSFFIVVFGSIYLSYVVYQIIRPELTGIKARPLRPLTEGERQELERRFMDLLPSLKHVRSYFVESVASILLAAILIIIEFFLQRDIYQIVAFFLACIIFLFGLYRIGSGIFILNQRYYIPDLQSPVHQITGKVYIPPLLDNKFAGRTSDFKIGKWPFEIDRTQEKYRSMAKSIQNGEIIRVEFSPRTKFVWKIEKTKNLVAGPGVAPGL